MIFDTLKNKKNYFHNPQLKKALEFLSSVSSENFPTETVVILKDHLFANPVTLTSKPDKDCVFEAHQSYMDLHYIVEGIEGIATAGTSSLTETIPYESGKDIGFYQGDKDGIYYLKPGQFMVCWPEDAHMVAIMKDKPVYIRKMVVKIKVR